MFLLECLLVDLLDLIDDNLLLQVCLHYVFGLLLFLQVLYNVLYFDGLLHQVILQITVYYVCFVQALLTFFQVLLALCEGSCLVNMCICSETLVFLWLQV